MKTSIITTTARSLAIAVGITAATSGASAADTGPRINLFPAPVVDQFNDMRIATGQLESAVYEDVKDLEKLEKLYSATQCNDSFSEGCAALERNMRESYNRFLQTWTKELNALKPKIQDTVEAVEGRLRTEVGRKMTGADFQRAIAGRAKRSEFKPAVTVDGKPKGRLSQTFSRHYEMVKRSSSQSSNAPVLAAEVYNDMRGAQYYMELIETEISAQMTENVINLEWGSFNEQMAATVSSVKGFLYGEADQAQEISTVGLEVADARDNYQDLFID
ncbi:hypothetical protein F0M18_13600 [Pseudohalioglobus sediminis]|uniref:Uncharacterized protein n=1 Tax=Pseudohalioglobus sediminis TaxID=2606449 RepID=A0A5B0WUX1_9GAMM|nr:hypothetical protein [Pseudohalioglobus sediminis]KAA1190095.1 hypothetical protein F0M18_13600 [Pseudohalioglobus sediminis]